MVEACFAHGSQGHVSILCLDAQVQLGQARAPREKRLGGGNVRPPLAAARGDTVLFSGACSVRHLL